MNCKPILFLLATALVASACYHEQDIPISIDFQYKAVDETYTAPARIEITNTTTGADLYRWIFEGGSPSTSNKRQPGTITYDHAGSYTIRLEAWNDFQRNFKEMVIVVDSAVMLNFDATILTNDFSPVTIQLTNHTKGASSYAWTFEGGTPSTSLEAEPPPVVFSAPGEHVISLTVSNGRQSYTSSKTILVKDPLEVDFEMIPSFEDADYEAPLTATLANKTVSGLRYAWASTGGTIENQTAQNGKIFFSNPGVYTVSLTAGNDKETQTVQHSITIKPNTNIFTMSDVKLGISSAHASIGSFYSTPLRAVFKKADVTTEAGPLIDLVFYAINSNFGYCRFISPDSAFKFTFPSIAQARHTSFINTLENSTVSFSAADFDAMTTDAPLTNLPIKENESGTAFFTDSVVPRIILFETDDVRKGAIKIKKFEKETTQSSITVDIKVQKLKR